MELIFKISQSEREEVKEFYNSMQSNQFVQRRIEKNIKNSLTSVSNELFWESLVSALLTTQQRSGPNSAISIFLQENPFPLSLSEIGKQTNIKQYVIDILSQRKGIRSYNKIAGFLSDNYSWLNNNGWESVQGNINQLIVRRNQQTERAVSNYLSSNLKGIGPKQSRNLLQMIGLTRYEIPIDSRITKWLNSFGFPIKLSATGLSDDAYYEFINDGVIVICNEIGIYPCELDAAIFASYDGDEWNNVADSKW